jgi:hypothetical protein
MLCTLDDVAKRHPSNEDNTVGLGPLRRTGPIFVIPRAAG